MYCNWNILTHIVLLKNTYISLGCFLSTSLKEHFMKNQNVQLDRCMQKQCFSLQSSKNIELSKRFDNIKQNLQVKHDSTFISVIYIYIYNKKKRHTKNINLEISLLYAL